MHRGVINAVFIKIDNKFNRNEYFTKDADCLDPVRFNEINKNRIPNKIASIANAD